MRPRWLNPRSSLAAAILILAVLSFVPPRYGGWVTDAAQPVRFVLAALASPFNAVVGLLRRDELAPRELGAMDQMRIERDGYLREVNQLRAENDALRRVIVEFERGRELNPDLAVRQFNAPVISSSMDLSSRMLTVRAGTHEGVESNASVAVVRGVHLVGRVVGVPGARFCSVLPFTDRSAGAIQGVVMLDPTRFGPACFLEPRGDGTLVGRLMTESISLPTGASSAAPEAGGADPASGAKAGMIVRLADDSWPQSAQMLELGVVESVDTPADNLRIRTIIVRPRYRIDRASEVTLRVPAPAPGEPR